ISMRRWRSCARTSNSASSRAARRVASSSPATAWKPCRHRRWRRWSIPRARAICSRRASCSASCGRP
ncbi:hypothetical protein LTR94_038670, partial [Friedmanniomyces endolithicus]